MIYRQRNKNKNTGTKVIFSLIVFLVILRIFNISIFVDMFDAPVNYILESNTVVLSPLKNTLVYFKSKKDLEEQVRTLQSENTNLKLENILGQTVTQEFEYFKTQFGEDVPENKLYKVILKPPFTPFDNIQITGDLSTKNIGDFVFYKSILIGKIIEKNNRYATVELFSTPNKIIPITIQGQQFEAKGLGGGRFIFEVSKELEINQGEPIIYPEQKLLILGVAEFIESKEENLFKNVYFNVPIPISSISYVSVGI
jgi:cell shape-determining protein MreC